MVHGTHAEKLWTSQLSPVERDYIQDRSCSPIKSVLDLKINVFLPERFLAHPEPDSLGRAGGKALGFHLELSSGGSHTLRRDFVFFYHCLFSAQRYRNSVSLSRCPGIWKFRSSPSLSWPSLKKHFPFRELWRLSTGLAILLVLRLCSSSFHMSASCLLN